jgi:hypothetical protein
MKGTIDLRLEDNDYMSYMRRFKQLVNRLKIIGQGMADDVLHDLFILGLEKRQCNLVNQKLDEFYSGGHDEVRDLDLHELMNQLTARAGSHFRSNNLQKSSKGFGANQASSSAEKDTEIFIYLLVLTPGPNARALRLRGPSSLNCTYRKPCLARPGEKLHASLVRHRRLPTRSHPVLSWGRPPVLARGIGGLRWDLREKEGGAATMSSLSMIWSATL